MHSLSSTSETDPRFIEEDETGIHAF